MRIITAVTAAIAILIAAEAEVETVGTETNTGHQFSRKVGSFPDQSLRSFSEQVRAGRWQTLSLAQPVPCLILPTLKTEKLAT